MADKLATVMPKVAQLLLIALGRGSTDGERMNAVHAVQRHLEGADSDSHELIERIRAPPLDEDEMKKIFDAGREQGRADEAEQRRRAAVAVTTQFTDGEVGDGVNGYSWREIAGHCAANAHRLNAWEREFCQSIAEQLASFYRQPTEKQAPILRRIFLNRFSGKI